jgi:autoinducer 2-degrading protein
MYAIIVKVRVKPEHRDRFVEAISDDAACSVRDEPGCFRFDVLQDQEEPDVFYFYEVYEDEAAFQAHTRTPHFALWDSAAQVVLAEAPLITRTRSVVPNPYS